MKAYPIDKKITVKAQASCCKCGEPVNVTLIFLDKDGVEVASKTFPIQVDCEKAQCTFVPKEVAISLDVENIDKIKYVKCCINCENEKVVNLTQECTIEIVSEISGYYYSCDGKFIKYVEGSNWVNIEDKKGNVTKLGISYDDFVFITGVLAKEDTSSEDAAKAVTQTTFNAVKLKYGSNLTIDVQAIKATELLKTYYSSVGNKTNLQDDNNNISARNARMGLIHVMQGKEDLSKGAILWDGIDFADKGLKHNKATVDGGISISKEHWEEFIIVCKFDDKGHLMYGQRESKAKVLAKLPFGKNINEIKTKLKLNNIHRVEGNKIETLGTGTYNKNNVLYKSVAVVGQQIYWAPYKEHANNKSYIWENLFGR